MSSWWLLLFLLISIGLYIYYRPRRGQSWLIPRVIHCIYLPWDLSGKWKVNEHDFDHSYVEQLQTQVQREEWTVRCWTRTALQQLNPEVWKVVSESAVYPVQIVDFYRWYLLEAFGGLYVQYGTSLNYPMEYYLPSTVQKTLRVFTERWFPWGLHRLWFSAEKWSIRNGQPEESLRIGTAFAVSIAHAPALQRFIKKLLQRMQTMKPTQDYDVLYIGGNAYLSEFYDQHLQNDATVECVPWWTTLQLFTVCSRGSWRMDDLPLVQRQQVLSSTVASRNENNTTVIKE